MVTASLYAVTTFHTLRLQQIAHTVGLTITLSANQDTILTHNARQYHVCTNDLGDVSHIGYPLFAQPIIEACGQADACRFVERYLLELDLKLDGKSATEKMDVDRVVMTKGGYNQLKTITPEVPFGIEIIKRRMFRLTWTKPGQKLQLTFPADCQLLKCANAVELENNLVRDLKRMPLMTEDIIPMWEGAKYSKSENMLIIEGGRFLSDAIRGDIYLVKRGETPQLFCSEKNISRTVSNIMLTGQYKNPLTTQLTIDRYGYKTEELTTTIQQLISLFQNEGCQLYFGIKQTGNDRLTGTLFTLNEKLAYSHVMSIDFPTAIIKGENLPIKARLYAYIPLQNVTEKFFTNDINNK